MSSTTRRTGTLFGLTALAVAATSFAAPTVADGQEPSGTVVVLADGTRVPDPNVVGPEALREETRMALAAIFRSQARQLHTRTDRWGDAARFHYYSALYRGMRGDESANDLLLAGTLFQANGESERACAVLEKAASIHLIEGRKEASDKLFLIAASVDRLSCAARWDEIFEGMEVPRPAQVSVAPPDIPVTDFRVALVP
ncbi:MAG: hypothetical protein ACE5HP_12590 [Gemmatimonadota bacterium]